MKRGSVERSLETTDKAGAADENLSQDGWARVARLQ